jgi:hypothetical protein
MIGSGAVSRATTITARMSMGLLGIRVRNAWAKAAKLSFFMLTILATLLLSGSGAPSVEVAPMDAVGPRPVEQQTRASVVRDYLQAWRGMAVALKENQADVLDSYFVGIAKEKLTDTIREQEKLGIHVSYQDRSHNIKALFYSPEGLSLQLQDDVEYDVELRTPDGVAGTEHVHSRYIAVLTPTESKWKVRIFQGAAS